MTKLAVLVLAACLAAYETCHGIFSLRISGTGAARPRGAGVRSRLGAEIGAGFWLSVEQGLKFMTYCVVTQAPTDARGDARRSVGSEFIDLLMYETVDQPDFAQRGTTDAVGLSFPPLSEIECR